VLEVIVSRMRYVAAQVGRAAVRFVGLSTALANAHVRRVVGC
jgi:replicative superfamily II helicase